MSQITVVLILLIFLVFLATFVVVLVFTVEYFRHVNKRLSEEVQELCKLLTQEEGDSDKEILQQGN